MEIAAETTRQAVEAGTDGVKFHLLHVLRGTDLETEYRAGKFRCLTLEEYARWLSGMFVGPTVSLMTSYESYKSFLIPVIVICVVTTILTMAITGCAAQILMFRHNRKERKHHDQ